MTSDDPKKVLSKIKNKIDVNCPVIVGLASHPTYKNHWVVFMASKKIKKLIVKE